MAEKYIIEIAGKDEQDYEVKYYYNGIYADEYGIVRITTTIDPLCAKQFTSVATENRSSIVKVVENSMKGCQVSVKKLRYTVTNA